MTLPRPHITFHPPIKVHDPKTDIYVITGLCKHYNSVLVIHEYGYTDIEYVSEEVMGKVEEKLKKICQEKTNI